MLEADLDSTSDAITYLDRETGTVREETIYGRAALEYGYGTTLGRLAMSLMPHGLLSHLYGFLNRLPSSKSRIPAFVSELGIDANEAALPLQEYRSLNEFFCRRLKSEARPIDDSPGRLLSPADGRILVFQDLAAQSVEIKGCELRLEELILDSHTAKTYEHGSLIVVRLAPCDYHRFHFPDTGLASESRLVKGRLHSVHPIALAARAPAFRNKRAISFLDSEAFGRIALVEVGAFAVGTIVQTYAPGPVARGQEKGYFRFGGSTIVMLVEPGRMVMDEDLLDASGRGIETFVKMGTSLGGLA